MAIHPDFLKSQRSILNPDISWFPADEALLKKSQRMADAGYDEASDTSKSTP